MKVLTDPGPQGEDQYPRWKPGGSLHRLLPNPSRKGPGCGLNCTLQAAFTVPAAGGPATQLTHGPAGVLCCVANVTNCDENPDWSPDGKQLSYDRSAALATGGGTHDDIWIANADGSSAHPITNPVYPVQDVWAAWSPDGKTLAFLRQNVRDGQLTYSSIFTVRSDGTGLRQVTPASIKPFPNFNDPSWSPDGSKIITTLGDCETGTSSIYTVRPDGTGLTNLTANSPVQYCSAAYSPDGKYIIAAGPQTGVNSNQAQLYLLTSAGTQIRVVDPDPGFWQSQPQWLPGSS